MNYRIDTTFPAGHYALFNKVGHKIYFFEIDKPKTGKWAGFTFVKQMSGDNRIAIKDPEAKFYILRAIQNDPVYAATLYGHELGCCALCGRTLTDEDSRALGIGPVCVKKLGDFAEDRAWKIAAARREAEQERAAYQNEMDTVGV